MTRPTVPARMDEIVVVFVLPTVIEGAVPASVRVLPVNVSPTLSLIPLRVTSCAAATVPLATAVKLALIVKFVLAVMAVMVAPAGIPVPVTVMPIARPVVLVVVITA